MIEVIMEIKLIYNQVQRILRRCLSFLCYPLRKDSVFFVLFFVLISIPYVRWCRAQLYNEEAFPLLFILRNITISLFWSYLVTSFLIVCRSTVVRYFLYGISILLIGVELFLKVVFDKDFTPEVVLLFAETNGGESKEFLTAYSLPVIVTFAISVTVFIIVVIFDRLLRKRQCSFSKGFSILIFGGVFVGLLAGFVNIYRLSKCNTTVDVVWWSINNHIDPKDVLTNVIYCCYDVYLSGTEMKYAIKETEKAYSQNNRVYDDMPLTVVLVIGESHIKHHSSVYGYVEKTNPYMEENVENGTLTTFSDVIAPFKMTSQSVRNMLNCNSIGNHELWYNCPFFPAIFKKASYNVFLWDMQKAASNPMDFTLNSYLYDNKLCKLTYNKTNDRTFMFDGELVDDFFNRYPTLEGKNLVIFHLMGQHIEAKERYPSKDFSVFTKDSILRKEKWLTQEMKQEIAEYDNAILYNDYVLHKIIEKLEESNAILVYLSDHGEEIYDYRPSKGRRDGGDEWLTMKYQIEIPFWVWCSKKYKSVYPNIVADIRNSNNKPFMIDNLCHLMFHIGGVESSYYRSDRDVLDSSYVCPPRLVYDKDYDIIMFHSNARSHEN